MVALIVLEPKKAQAITRGSAPLTAGQVIVYGNADAMHGLAAAYPQVFKLQLPVDTKAEARMNKKLRQNQVANLRHT